MGWRIGVLGSGVPLVTVDFMRNVILNSPARREQIPMVVYSIPQVADPAAAILEDGSPPGPELCAGVKTLERFGASVICLPSSMAHAWYEDMSASVRVPIIHIVDAVARELHRIPSRPRRVGLLAGSATIAARIYPSRAGDVADWVIPDEDVQDAVVMDAIRMIKAGRLEAGTRRLWRAARHLVRRQGVDALVLSIDLSTSMASESLPVPVIESTLALARRAVRCAVIGQDRGRTGPAVNNTAVDLPLGLCFGPPSHSWRRWNASARRPSKARA